MAAILLSNFVWEGTSLEMLPDLPGVYDGHFYKQLDTGESYICVNGVWEYINLGLAFIKATKSGNAVTDGSGLYTHVFTTAFIDNQYSVALTCGDPGGGIQVNAYVQSKTAASFTIITRRVPGGGAFGNTVFSWLCTRDYDP